MEQHKDQHIIRFLEGKISKQEEIALDTWRNAHPNHEQQFQEVKFLWEATHLAKDQETPLQIDTDAALKKVRHQLTQEAKVIPFRKRLFQWTAAASVLLLLGFFAWNFFFHPIAQVEIFTANDETKQLTLPDESVVWLNENSSLSYPEKFTLEQRVVRLSGDAVFEVQSNPNQPFVVESEELEVKVLGTKFNVQARKDQAALVHVLHGKVEVNNKNTPEDQVILTKGKTVQLDKNTDTLSLQESFSQNQLFWLNRRLQFEATPFEEVLSTLQETYETEIILTNSTLKKCPVRGVFKEKTLDEILNTLQLIYRFEIEKNQANSIQINKGTCN